jgi:3',5'-cyclic AMP phosphodiesterase CpdA
MAQPRDLFSFATCSEDGRKWRVAHLSDIHVVGERYGFRVESGRSGPQGNERLALAMAKLDAIHATNPLDLVLITGDITDAGRSAEWAEFFGVLVQYPRIASLVLCLPGNHDLNVVDRANPARLDLPMSPKKRLRQVRTISALSAVQGASVRIFDRETQRLGQTLEKSLESHKAEIAAFADKGSIGLSISLAQLWTVMFPMVKPPNTDDGLGIIILNSNAETHFSFTNALGMVSSEQTKAIDAIADQYPHAYWIVALHHHLVEYPKAVKKLSERIGTALINGSWLMRHLGRLDDRAVVMHGHRHIDWMGECGGLVIISAPSPVMGEPMIVTHISMSILSRRQREASWACSRPNASTCLVVGRPMVRRREKTTQAVVVKFMISFKFMRACASDRKTSCRATKICGSRI